MRQRDSHSSYNFWPCVSDLMLACFAFMMLLWIVQQIANTRLAAANTALQQTLQAAATPSPTPPEDWRALYAQSKKKLDDVLIENALLKKQPPILNMPEAEGFTFAPGRADLTVSFDAHFEPILKKLTAWCAYYGGNVDTIEVIGHTDEKPYGGAGSDLDTLLPKAIKENGALDHIRCGSNADLGLLRAVAVKLRLERAQREGKLPPLPVNAYSAAQLVPPTHGDSIDPAALRRIEIRLTRCRQVTDQAQNAPTPVP